MLEFNKVLIEATDDRVFPILCDKAARLLKAGGALELFTPAYDSDVNQGVKSLEEDAISRKAHLITQKEARLDQQAQQLSHFHQIEVGTDVSWCPDALQALRTKIERYQPELVCFPMQEGVELLHFFQPPDSWKLIRETRLPVLLGQAKSWSEHACITVAIDPFSESGRPLELDLKLLRWGRLLAKKLQAELHVIHAYSALPHSAIFDEHLIADYAALQEKVAAQHHKRIEQMLAPWNDEEGAPQIHVIQGEFHQVVPDFCRERNVDLMLVGNVERSWLERVFQGSSVERVMDHLTCDLLVLHPDD